jgi:hypothetical protein
VHRRSVSRLLGLGFSCAVLVSACGGDDGSVSVESTAGTPPTTVAASPTTASPATTSEGTTASPATTEGTATTAAAGNELPQFVNDFDRVCKTQVGFSGATAYTATPGVHPAVILEDAFEDDDLYIPYSPDLPAGWVVQEDSNFEDNSELAPTQLVVCIDRVAAAPTGTQCEFDSDGTKVSLELTNGTFDVRVYEAKSGKPVGTASLSTNQTECPSFVTFKKGDTQWFASLDADTVTNALKQYISSE